MLEISNAKVYKHTSPTGKVYIGITTQDVKARWGNGNNYSSNKRFRNAIKKYGWDNFTHEVIFDGLSIEDAKNKEIELIALYDATNPEKGYNVTLGGESGYGYRHTEQTKQRIREAMVGRVSPMKGRTHSAETKNKISVGNIKKGRRSGFTLSDETKQKISNSQKGLPKPKSEEYKVKMSEIKKGVIISDSTKSKISTAIREWYRKNGERVLQISLDGKILRKWNNQSEAFRELGIKQSTFNLHIANGKPLGGFIYIKEKHYKEQ